MVEIENKSLSYLATHMCDRQWRPFLQALADELGQQMEATERRQLMHALGRRIAADSPLSEAQDLDTLSASMNEFWDRLEWGYVEIHEEDAYVALLHHCAPLRGGFGDAAMTWTPALLEGIYAQWFADFGAGDDLLLRQIGEPQGGDDALEYRLGLPEAIERA